MTTETIIIDAGKFGLDGLLLQAMTLGSWMTSQNAGYEVRVDHDCNLHITMDADVAVHFKLVHHAVMITEEKLAERENGWLQDLRNTHASPSPASLHAALNKIRNIP